MHLNQGYLIIYQVNMENKKSLVSGGQTTGTRDSAKRFELYAGDKAAADKLNSARLSHPCFNFKHVCGNSPALFVLG